MYCTNSSSSAFWSPEARRCRCCCCVPPDVPGMCEFGAESKRNESGGFGFEIVSDWLFIVYSIWLKHIRSLSIRTNDHLRISWMAAKRSATKLCTVQPRWAISRIRGKNASGVGWAHQQAGDWCKSAEIQWNSEIQWNLAIKWYQDISSVWSPTNKHASLWSPSPGRPKLLSLKPSHSSRCGGSRKCGHVIFNGLCLLIQAWVAEGSTDSTLSEGFAT